MQDDEKFMVNLMLNMNDEELTNLFECLNEMEEEERKSDHE